MRNIDSEDEEKSIEEWSVGTSSIAGDEMEADSCASNLVKPVFERIEKHKDDKQHVESEYKIEEQAIAAVENVKKPKPEELKPSQTINDILRIDGKKGKLDSRMHVGHASVRAANTQLGANRQIHVQIAKQYCVPVSGMHHVRVGNACNQLAWQFDIAANKNKFNSKKSYVECLYYVASQTYMAYFFF